MKRYSNNARGRGIKTDEIVKADEFRDTIERTVQEIDEVLAQEQKQQEAVITDQAPSSTPVENSPQRAVSPNNNASEREVGEQQQHAVDSPRIYSTGRTESCERG